MIILLVALVLSIEANHKFLYKHSFKFPFSSPIPHFNTTGETSFSERFIRLCPSIPNKNGLITSEKLSLDAISFILQFKVSGRGLLGGSGLATSFGSDFTLSDSKHSIMGLSPFHGYSIIMSTSDSSKNRRNSYVYAIYNDGSKSQSDYSNYQSVSENVLGGCFMEYRNNPHTSHLNITILNKRLTVSYDLSHSGADYTECFSADIPHFPSEYNVALSSRTEKYSDDHDIISFETFDLNPSSKPITKKVHDLTSEEKQKIKKIEKIVEDVQDSEDKDTDQNQISAVTVEKMLETQFKIIETLESLEKKVEKLSNNGNSNSQSSPTSSHNFMDSLSAIQAGVGSMMDKIQGLEKHLVDAARLFQKLEDSISEKVHEVHESVKNSHEEITSIHQDNNGLLTSVLGTVKGFWAWFSYSFFGVVICGIFYGLFAVMRTKKPEKKFI